ncbi:MAG: hypothetical protein WA738_09270 [Candidatus Angelobacter sp.]
MASFTPAPAACPILRDGGKLIVPAAVQGWNIPLPPPCVKCGAPANGKPVHKNFSWHHPALYLLILAGVLVYLIVALIVRKSMRLTVPLCAQHAQRRSLAVNLAWVIPLIGIADAFILPNFGVDGGLVALITVVMILAGIVIWAIVDYPIRPKFIDQYHGVFTGFCEAYLQQFPPAGRN